MINDFIQELREKREHSPFIIFIQKDHNKTSR